MPPTPALELAAWAVARVALFPVEVLDPLGDPELARRGAALADEAEACAAEGVGLADALAELVPRVEDRAERAAVIELRRALHGGRAATTAKHERGRVVTGRLDAGLARRLQRHETELSALARRREDFAASVDGRRSVERAAVRQAASADDVGRALAVGNPELFDRWWPQRREPVPEHPTARQRRLEVSLLNHLARAAGRAAPNQAWAGVAPVGPPVGDPVDGGDVGVAAGLLVVDRTAPVVRIEVDLAALEHLADPDAPLSSQGWVERERTLIDHGDGRWELRPHLERVELLGPAVHRAVLDAVPPGARVRAGDVVERAAAALAPGGDATPIPAADGFAVLARQAFDELVAARVLHAVPAVPRGAPSSWAALAELVASVDPAHRARAAEALATLRRRAGALARRFAALDPVAVRDAARSIDAALDDLLVAVGDDPSGRRGSAVRVNVRAPFVLRWTPGGAAAAARAVDAVLGATAAWGGAEAFRRARSAAVPGGGTLVEAALAFVPPTPPPPDALLDTWTGLLARTTRGSGDVWPRSARRTATSAALPVLAGPLGSLLFELGGGGSGLRLGGGRPQAAVFAHRYAAEVPSVVEEVRRWYRAWDDAGVTAVEVVGRRPLNPGAGCGPALATRAASATGEWFDRLRPVSVDGDRPVLLDAAGRRYVPVYESNATLGLTEALDALVFRLAMGHGWEAVGLGPGLDDVVTSDEAGDPGATRAPHVLDDGTTWAGRVAVVPASVVAGIASAHDGAERFARWCALARRVDLPRLVWARPWGNRTAPASLVVTDSPLSVDAFLEGFEERAPRVVFEHLPGDPSTWPVTGAGGHHLAEVAVSWRDRGYWAAVIGAPEFPDDPEVDRPTGDDSGDERWFELRLVLPFDDVQARPAYPWALLADVERVALEAGATGTFFVRKPPGLRVRVAASSTAVPAVERAVADAVGRALSAGTVTDIRRATYEPEVHRFGGAAGMALAHRLLVGISSGAVRFERAPVELRVLAPASTVVAAIVTALARAGLGDPAEVWDVWMRLRAVASPHRPDGPMPTAPEGLHLALHDPAGWAGGLPSGLAADVVVPGLVLARDVGTALAGSVAAGELAVGARAWTTAASLFCWNAYGLGLDPADLCALVDAVTAELAPDS